VPTLETLRRLTGGIELDDGLAKAHKARILEEQPDRALVQLVMMEGRNREVRRMLSHVGHEVTSLVRTAIGPIADRTLKAGESRRLSPEEIRQLLASGVP